MWDGGCGWNMGSWRRDVDVRVWNGGLRAWDAGYGIRDEGHGVCTVGCSIGTQNRMLQKAVGELLEILALLPWPSI